MLVTSWKQSKRADIDPPSNTDHEQANKQASKPRLKREPPGIK